MGVWSLQDGEDFLVQIQQEHNCSIRGKLLGAIGVTLEVELITFVYQKNLSFFPTSVVHLITSHLSIDQNMKHLVQVPLTTYIIKTFLVLSFMLLLEYHILWYQQKSPVLQHGLQNIRATLWQNNTIPNETLSMSVLIKMLKVFQEVVGTLMEQFSIMYKLNVVMASVLPMMNSRNLPVWCVPSKEVVIFIQ